MTAGWSEVTFDHGMNHAYAPSLFGDCSCVDLAFPIRQTVYEHNPIPFQESVILAEPEFGTLTDPDDGVDFEDLLYVTLMQGGDDFCADLDGSGLVDHADAAIVKAALGDEGLPVGTGVSDGGIGPWRPIRAVPNPANAITRFDFDAKSGDPVTVTVLDVAGRVVRRFPPAIAEGDRARVDWDLRDDDGRRVAPGVYFARVDVGAARHQVRLGVLR